MFLEIGPGKKAPSLGRSALTDERLSVSRRIRSKARTWENQDSRSPSELTGSPVLGKNKIKIIPSGKS